jgi:alkylhydroperoxidase family enzyme
MTADHTAPDGGKPSGTGWLEVPEPAAGAQRLFDEDVAELGYVMNASRMWARQPETFFGLFELMQRNVDTHGLDPRQRGILVTACASTLGDAYCSLAWGGKLSRTADADTAAGVLRGDDEGLTAAERALAGWARKVTRDPNHTSRADVQELRDAGYSDDQIFGITVFVALRIAFSTINDALGARPDAVYRTTAPDAVLDAVTFGRPIDDPPPQGPRGTG